MNLEEFTKRCPTLWHVGPPGAWEGIKRRGFQTAEQLIRAADVDEQVRARLLSEARLESVTLSVDGLPATLRDQQPLLRRRDRDSLMDDGMTFADWIRILNRRVYLFTDRAALDKVLAKYVLLDGAQEVITFSPRRVFETYRSRLELSTQNSGAVARVAGAQKRLDTFVTVGSFPAAKRPAEVTVVDGMDDLSVVAFVERHDVDGTKTPLKR